MLQEKDDDGQEVDSGTIHSDPNEGLESKAKRLLADAEPGVKEPHGLPRKEWNAMPMQDRCELLSKKANEDYQNQIKWSGETSIQYAIDAGDLILELRTTLGKGWNAYMKDEDNQKRLGFGKAWADRLIRLFSNRGRVFEAIEKYWTDNKPLGVDRAIALLNKHLVDLGEMNPPKPREKS